jgi:hypothetical protein
MSDSDGDYSDGDDCDYESDDSDHETDNDTEETEIDRHVDFEAAIVDIDDGVVGHLDDDNDDNDSCDNGDSDSCDSGDSEGYDSDEYDSYDSDDSDDEKEEIEINNVLYTVVSEKVVEEGDDDYDEVLEKPFLQNKYEERGQERVRFVVMREKNKVKNMKKKVLNKEKKEWENILAEEDLRKEREKIENNMKIVFKDLLEMCRIRKNIQVRKNNIEYCEKQNMKVKYDLEWLEIHKKEERELLGYFKQPKYLNAQRVTTRRRPRRRGALVADLPLSADPTLILNLPGMDVPATPNLPES